LLGWRQRHPELGGRQRKGKAFRHHAYDLTTASIQDERAADGMFVAGERAHPQFVTEDDDTVLLRLIFLVSKDAAQAGLHAEDAKDPNLVGELLSGGAVVLARLSGFQIYLLATTAVGALTAALGITLPFAIYTTLTTGLGVVLGPIGWVAIAISALFRLSQPNWSKLIPAIVYVSYIRHKLHSQ